MQIFTIIENEITNYIGGDVEISEGYRFSQYKLMNRILRYANGIYPNGKQDKQGNYKYWVDVSTPRVEAEVKNIDFDTKDITLYSEAKADTGAIMIGNLALSQKMRDEHKATEINDAIEEGAGFGNVVWKRIKGGYEKADLKNLFVINQTAQTLNDTPVIERHSMTQTQIREKSGVWENVDKVIEGCGVKEKKTTVEGNTEGKESPYYEIYERNGEVSEKVLKEAQGKKGGSDKKYVLAKIVVAGIRSGKGGEKFVLFADEIDEMPYREYHRGAYKGRWFRVGIYEILFDIQTRANAISNQIARGLEWASKVVFRSQDRLIVNNLLSQLKNGDVIKSTDLQQVQVRMDGLDQLIADWNRLMVVADKLCNSYEVVMGESLPSGTSFKLGAQTNQNANKLFDFLREKLAASLCEVFTDWELEDLGKELKRKDILRITGDENSLTSFYETLVNGWYIQNLLSFPPHGPEEATMLKTAKLQELMANPNKFLKLEKGWWDNVKPRVHVIITGENIALTQELETLSSFIALEADPVRRTALIELAMRKKGINVDKLPKTAVESPMQPQREQVTSNKNERNV